MRPESFSKPVNTPPQRGSEHALPPVRVKNRDTHAPLEHIAGGLDVRDYLRSSAATPHVPLLSTEILLNSSRPQLCPDILHCSNVRVEPVLLDDLEEAERAQKPEDADRLRKLIRSASWRAHERPDVGTLLRLAKTRLADVEAIQREWERVSLMDEAQDEEETAQDFRTIVEALERRLVERQMLPAVEAAERLVKRAWMDLQAGEHVVGSRAHADHPHLKRLQRQLDDVQRLRDQIYAAYLYPVWSKLAEERETPSQGAAISKRVTANPKTRSKAVNPPPTA